MSTSTTKETKGNGAAIVEAQQKANLPAISPPRLPYHPLVQERFGIDKAAWKALVEAIFPNATSVESVVLALSYCKARKLDPFKRNVHIVPIWDKSRGCMTDTVWPGIGELRTTAFRTGEYAGRGETVFGNDITAKIGSVEITYPEWAQVTVRRIVKGREVSFAGPRVYWIETYATVKRNDDTPNDMWSNRPRGQLEKCAEAAALRAAFPEEIGSDHIDDEVQHQKDSTVIDAKLRRSLDDLESQVALEGPKQTLETEQESDEVEQSTTTDEAPSESQSSEGITFDSLSNAVEAATTHAQLDGIETLAKQLDGGDQMDIEKLIADKRPSIKKGAK